MQKVKQCQMSGKSTATIKFFEQDTAKCYESGLILFESEVRVYKYGDTMR
jgi:hypothetical protein